MIKSSALLIPLLLVACGNSDQKPRLFQLCLASAAELSTLKEVLRTAADTEDLIYKDTSAETEVDMVDFLGRSEVAQPLLMVTASAKTSQASFIATNFASAPAQVLIGFHKEQELDGAQKLSVAVLSQLSRRWRVYPVAGDVAMPRADCAVRTTP